jgi:hypothetical protein
LACFLWWFAGVLVTSIIINLLFGKWLRAKPHWIPHSIGIAFNLVLPSALSISRKQPHKFFPLRFRKLAVLRFRSGSPSGPSRQ